MKRLIMAIIVAMSPGVAAAHPSPPRYAVAVSPAPVLNTPDFKHVFGGTLKLDPCQGVRPIEFIALTGTLFKVEGEQVKDGVTVYRVTSKDYPYPSQTGYFVDARFLVPVADSSTERQRLLPGIRQVQERLLAALGRPYVWGGNLKDGVPLLRELYPKADPLAGVDCSGLLYEATDGFTPRNTTALTTFGDRVAVAGLSPEKIAQKLQPLDLIVYKGHVMVVLDRDSIIQSTMGCQGEKEGVHLSPLLDTLRNLVRQKKPMDDFPKGAAAAKVFVVRRWFPR